MNCRKVSHLLSAYMDAELPGVEHRQVHEHISQCNDCASDYQALLRMKRLLAGMRMREPQADLPHRIICHIHAQDAISTPSFNWWWSMRGWLELQIPRRASLPIVASMAAVAIIYLSYAIDRNDEIAFPPSRAASADGIFRQMTAAEVAKLPPAPEVAPRTPFSVMDSSDITQRVGITEITPSSAEGDNAFPGPIQQNNRSNFPPRPNTSQGNVTFSSGR